MVVLFDTCQSAPKMEQVSLAGCLAFMGLYLPTGCPVRSAHGFVGWTDFESSHDGR
jgi:hypothetical protein